MYDSLQLAQQIMKHGMGNMYEAVREYEASMLPRGIDLIQRSAAAGNLLFALDAPRGWVKAFAGLNIDS